MKWNGLHLVTWAGASIGGLVAGAAGFWHWLTSNASPGMGSGLASVLALAEIAWAMVAGGVVFAAAFALVLAVGFYAERGGVTYGGFLVGLAVTAAGMICLGDTEALEPALAGVAASVALLALVVLIRNRKKREKEQDRNATEARHGSWVMLALAVGTIGVIAGRWVMAFASEPHATADDCDHDGGCGGMSATDTEGAARECPRGAVPSLGGCIEVHDARGIFVRTNGADMNEGSRRAPVRSFERASQLAKETGKVVFACAETFVDDTERLPSGVTVHGGLSCVDWSWTPEQRTVITRRASAVDTPLPLVVLPAKSGEGPTTIIDFEILAPEAVQAGASSVAVQATDAVVHFARSVIRAQRGADGAPGASPAGIAASGTEGKAGLPGGCGGSRPIAPEGAGPTTPACTGSMGGIGGVDGAGGDGAPRAKSSGIGAPPEPSTGFWMCPKQDGSPGADGAAGLGGTGDGNIVDRRYVGPPGADGEPGAPGQGGGGGGRRSGSCDPGYGASGGEGGFGGCGGLGGGGGQAGGSSIAVMSINSVLTFEDTLILPGAGGSAGRGGVGQSGGRGGPGGAAGDGSATCARGGSGGSGGAGGPGGGGRGGHSLGILFAGVQPDIHGATIIVVRGGLGGPGGTGSPATSMGADGLNQPLLEP